MHPPPSLETKQHFLANGDGWRLHAHVTRSPEHLRADRRPLLLVPGYGMNTFILGFHPRGTSMTRVLAEAGFEVWTCNLRRQGGSKAEGRRAPPPSMRAYATIDVPAAIDGVLSRTQTAADQVDLIGCSLGGSVAYTHLALTGGERVSSVVSIGGPLRWVDPHPLLRMAFRSPRLASLVRVRGTRRLARAVLPVLARTPKLLGIYMNADLCDLSAADQLVQTVDDPHPRVNLDIARWVNARDLVLGGVNVTEAMRSVDKPFLLVLANRDGIVPTGSAMSAIEAWGGDDKEVLHVGDDEAWYAHADLFIADRAPEVVFAPIAEWLHARNDRAA